MSRKPRATGATNKNEMARIHQARAINQQLTELYPDAHCALDYQTPIQLLVATILSAQCTDVRVNKVTPILFSRFGTVADFAAADLEELQTLIQSTGFFRNKAKNIKHCCQLLLERHGGEIPSNMEDLVQLPGVARKTANVVLGNLFGVPGITVDTHVGRLSRRMGLTTHHDPVKAEADLGRLLPAAEWVMFSHRMIFHGRQVCSARKPRCNDCPISSLCPKEGVTV